MKNIHFFLLAILISSCTKTIDLNLNDSDPKTIIEANLIEGTNNFVTKVSKTSNYYDNSSETSINNATVTINDGTTTQTLTHVGNGEYSIPSFVATENTTYTLTVVENGNTFTAVSQMPQKVTLDTLYYEYIAASAFNPEGYTLYFVFDDPANVRNFYRGTLNLNGEETKGVDDLYIFEDSWTDGNNIVIPVFQETYQAGDIISANLYSLNESNYQFYSTLDGIANSNGGGGSSAAPANPDNNWSNGALGNFTTATVSSFSGVVQ